jgi:predicted enzyme related to lactoylglutathione lyase
VKFTEYAQGTPCWIDLGSTDMVASKSFYTGLFGWEPQAGDPEYGGYSLCHVGPDAVAGIGPTMSPDQPVAWTTYLASDNLDETVERVLQAGGAVLAPSMDIGDQGRMAICVDPTGAPFGVWQHGVFAGAQLANEPNTWSWNELRTTDLPASNAFYSAAFGISPQVSDTGGVQYTLFNVNDRAVAGAMAMAGFFPPDVPSHWLPFFTVDNLEESMALAEKLGGQIISPVLEAEGVGRWTNVQDPQGAVFGIIQS